MSLVRWSPRAEGELRRLLTYIRERQPAAAQRAAADITASARRLGDHPALGRGGRLDGTRELSFPKWKQILVYRVHDQGVEIITLRDTRMLIEDRR